MWQVDKRVGKKKKTYCPSKFYVVNFGDFFENFFSLARKK